MVFCRNQVGFVLYKRRLSVNPSAHGVVLRFTWGFFGADVDKTVIFLSFACVCGCLLPMFCVFALAGFDIRSVKRRREQINGRRSGVPRGEAVGSFLIKRRLGPFV